MDTRTTINVTIADTQSLSGASPALDGLTVVGVMVPAANWNAAALTFQGSADGAAYCDVYYGAAELATASLAAGDGEALNPNALAPFRYVKVRSGTSGAAVAQAGGDTITLILTRA